MAHLTLNCPTCRKQLVYVPLDGMTLHYRCENHGLLIFKPLVQLSSPDQEITSRQSSQRAYRSHDAA